MTIPASVREIGTDAFCNCKNLKRICFQGDCELEKLGDGCFSGSGLEEFVAPPRLRRIGSAAFCGCASLRRVVLNEGLETVVGASQTGAFQSSGVEEITLPGTLREATYDTFWNCERLRAVYMEDSCEVNLALPRLSEPPKFYPLPETTVGNASIWSLRELREVAIPEGVERVGSCWFSHSGIRSVEIAASVRELGQYAFHSCGKLRRVSFQPGSRLEKVGKACFRGSALREIAIPSGVGEI